MRKARWVALGCSDGGGGNGRGVRRPEHAVRGHVVPQRLPDDRGRIVGDARARFRRARGA